MSPLMVRCDTGGVLDLSTLDYKMDVEESHVTQEENILWHTVLEKVLDLIENF